MNKNYLNIIVIIFCFLLTIAFFKNSELLTQSVINSINIFIKQVFPFLFIMMIINELYIKLNLPYYLNKIFPSPFIYIFILSALSGCPTNAIIIKSLLDNHLITEKDASISLCFSTINNPLFLYTYLNILFSSTTTFKFIFTIYIINTLFLLYYLIKYRKNKMKIYKTKLNVIKEFPNIITKSIIKLINIGAIIIFFKLMTDILLPTNNILSSLIKGLIEITQGLHAINILNVSTKIKELLTIVILIFSGFSIHIQISSILEDYQINYRHFYISRLIQSILAILILVYT